MTAGSAGDGAEYESLSESLSDYKWLQPLMIKEPDVDHGRDRHPIPDASADDLSRVDLSARTTMWSS